MLKKDVLDYIMNTPYNTNRAVLSGMLDAFLESGESEETEDLEEYLVESITITNDSSSTQVSINYPTVTNNKIVMNALARVGAGETITINTFQYAQPYVYSPVRLTFSEPDDVMYSNEHSLRWYPDQGGAVTSVYGYYLRTKGTEGSIHVAADL